jgi:hypothetical protein
MGDGEKVKLNHVVCVCTLVRNECPFLIDLVSFDLGSFGRCSRNGLDVVG